MHGGRGSESEMKNKTGRILNYCPKDFEWGGQHSTFGVRRCAFGDKPYGVAKSYSREGVDVEVNSSRNPEIGLWDSRSSRMG
ncbi:hypothetical protein PIB30_097590 [Stylosanthes scabra]|uniref:Uncharacterized protein n=1 Tax=Stylosanthes scabra TaxID=79078 RepID=A0ABU6VZH1_9FABA|nr:hypothetical protein [Stylosanthes scabra]